MIYYSFILSTEKYRGDPAFEYLPDMLQPRKFRWNFVAQTALWNCFHAHKEVR